MNLTPEQIEQNGEAVKAWQRGEPVQSTAIEGGYIFKTTPEPSWSFSIYLYRPAPKPTPPVYVPFTRETIPMPCVVRNAATENRFAVSAAAGNGVSVLFSNGSGFVKYEELLREFTMDDGSTCGTIVTP